MNLMCAYCSRPLLPQPMPSIGGIRFCSTEHVAAWFSDGRHDRRREQHRVAFERRTA